MKNEDLDVFARALLFLRKARLESAGFTADLKAIQVEEQTASNRVDITPKLKDLGAWGR